MCLIQDTGVCILERCVLFQDMGVVTNNVIYATRENNFIQRALAVFIQDTGWLDGVCMEGRRVVGRAVG
jgi:hypothetical protein